MAEPGLPTITEEVIDSLVKDLVNDIEFITDTFMPDGHKFRQDTMSDDEALDKYLESGLHDNPQAAADWIRNGVMMLTNKLAQFGVPPEMWAAAHPYDIVQTAGFKLSYKMENLLREREGKTAQTPPVSFPTDEADDPANTY